MTEPMSSLPTEAGGTAVTRFNALRHGVLSRYTVLPWEDAEEYRALVETLVAEYRPQGPTEEHLVVELAGILWRKRRLRLAEAAAHRRGLHDAVGGYRKTEAVALVHVHGGERAGGAGDAIRDTADETQAAVRDMEADETMTRRALDLLGLRQNDSYEAALAALRADTRDWWADRLVCGTDDLDEGEAPYGADSDHLRRFVETQVLPWYDRRRTELANRPLIREQAFGEALDPDKLERLGRYEVHLDRKLERTLAMLLRLKDLRQGTVAD